MSSYPPPPDAPDVLPGEDGGAYASRKACEALGAELSGHATAFRDIAAERTYQVERGRDANHDDARAGHEPWLGCLVLVVARHASAWRRMWVKIGSVAVSAIESHDRRVRR